MAQESDRLSAVTINWDEATSTLIGNGLSVVRVTRSKPEDQVTVIWRREPSPEDQQKANRLIRGAVPIHSW